MLLASCAQGPEAPADTIPSERVYEGTLPCGECEGVFTSIVLRKAGQVYTYLMTEQYQYEDGPAQTISDSGSVQVMNENPDAGGDTVFWFNRPNAGDDRFFRRLGEDSLVQVGKNGLALSDASRRILIRRGP